MLSNFDRELLQRCLNRSTNAWEDFVDRFIGLVHHVVEQTAHTRAIYLDTSTRDELVSDVFFALVKDDFAVLRNFRQSSSLATYLTVVARRIVVRSLLQRRLSSRRERDDQESAIETASQQSGLEEIFENRESVESAIASLSQEEASAIRMFHFEGKTYREIGSQMGLNENSVGPYLSRVRAKMRQSISGTELRQ